MKLAIVIPTHNEATKIARVLQGILNLEIPDIHKEIIVVNDGSTDRTASIASSKGVTVVTHLINRGLGGALGTGIMAALRGNADLIVTFDADGQHSTKDIPSMIKPILMKQADVVIGSRMLRGTGMPVARQVANRIANLVTWILFDIWTTDSQSGLRAFSRFAAERLRITSNNYDVSSEICGEIKRNQLRFVEIPIRPIYTDYSLSKGQGLLPGIKTFLRLLLHVTGRPR